MCPLAIYECVGVCSCVCVYVCVSECFTFVNIGDLLVSVYDYECVSDRVCVRQCFSFVYTGNLRLGECMFVCSCVCLYMRDFVCESASVVYPW